MYRRLLFVISAAAFFCAIGSSSVLAEGCAELGKINYSQGELYAVFERGLGSGGRPAGDSPHRLEPYAPIELAFAPNLRLIYVLDSPAHSTLFQEVSRDFSGVIAVRLVATGSKANQHAPTVVRLYRDAVKTNRRQREALLKPDFPALTYYVYHNHRQLLASDSFLDREFHTGYVYQDGQPDRWTNDPQERRDQFHFPEMKEAPPSDSLIAKVSSEVFGSPTALAATPDAGFEAQIKYYPKSITPRCLRIDTQLPSAEDRALKITLKDLDYPGGLNAPGSSGIWTIIWKSPATSR
jgi:hypothetical protein